jgi:hypothetical protein
MSCHRYHIDRPVSDEELSRLFDELLGGPVTKLPEEHPLDELLATRTHVRILRVLTLLVDDINLTGRDIARHARISRTRAQEVLTALVATGVVVRYREATWAIYEMNASSSFAPLVRSLFEQERDLTPT